MAYSMMTDQEDYKRRGFLPPENFDAMPTDANDVRVQAMQGQPQANMRPAPSGGGNAMRIMDVPEGAQMRRTVSMQDPDGRQVREVASWVHSPAAPARMEQPGRFERLERQRDNMGGSREARERRLQYGDRMRMMDASRLDRIGKENADRLTAETLEAIKAGGQMGAEGAKAAGVRDAAQYQADAAAAGREQDAYFKGLDAQGRQRDDERSDAQLDLNRQQLGLQEAEAGRRTARSAAVQQSVQQDVEAGKASGQPVETWKDPVSGRQFYRNWGDIDDNGAKTGWKPVQTDIMGGITGAPGTTAPTATPTAGAQVGPTAPLKRRTQDGRTALYDPNTKAFIGYE